MTRLETHGCAVNAAGIADQFRLRQFADADGESRLRDISAFAGGWIGVAAKLGEAGEWMERVRAEHGQDAKWGEGLPHVYDVWWAIARAMWESFESEDLERLVRLAVAEASPGVDEEE